MARKVFISVLGTGNYQECTYTKDDFKSTARFVQQSILEYHKKKGSAEKKNAQEGTFWAETDCVYILLTKGARDQNWEVCKDIKGNVVNEKGLRKVLVEMKTKGDLNARIEDIDIKDGKNEEELWDIFTTIYNVIEDGDKIYFDLTHGFRYLPMLVLVFGNYVKFMKNAEIKAITYGNFEMSNRGKDPAPIIDLLPLSKLQDWTFATAQFLKTGNVDKLKDLMQPDSSNYMKYMGEFIDNMVFCRQQDVYDCTKSLGKADPESINFGNIPITLANNIVGKIEKSVGNFCIKESDCYNSIIAAKWLYEKMQYQAAITMLQEGIITILCNEMKWKVNKKKYRETVRSAFEKHFIEKNNNGEKNFSYPNDVNKKDVDNVYNIIKGDIIDIYCELRYIRNDFNHAGMVNQPIPRRRLKTRIKNVIDKIVVYYNLQ